MDESAIKGDLVGLNDSDAGIRKSSSMMSRIYVEGYDTSLSGHDLVFSLREHFASCGEVIHVYIPGYKFTPTHILSSFALIYLRGKGAEEKALKLSGSYMGRHKVVAKPFHAEHLHPEFAPTRDADNMRQHMMTVEGYDTKLPVDYVKSVLIQHFSKCGLVLSAIAHKDESKGFSKAMVILRGQDAIDKALHLGGCDVEGFENMEVSRVVGPAKKPRRTGFVPNNNPRYMNLILDSW